MKRFWIAAAFALAACASPQEAPRQGPVYNSPPIVEPAYAPPPMPVEAAGPKDACGAYEMQHLVGRHRSEIPVPVEPSRRRVACTSCPVTMDYRADRLNIFFDADSGIIKEVKCG